MRSIVAPTKNERGEETHPAFGLIGASRGQVGPPGATLFDSDIQHGSVVMVTIRVATRERHLNRDWIHPAGGRAENGLVQVEMSEAQWASFVSSMNTGHGVPCTITRREDDWNIPGLPHEPRLAESMGEVRAAGDRVLAVVSEALEAVEAKPTKANIRHLRAMVNNAVPNMTYAARSLNEHAENVVQRARADIESMVLAKAQQLGLDPGELGGAPQLEAGEGEGVR